TRAWPTCTRTTPPWAATRPGSAAPTTRRRPECEGCRPGRGPACPRPSVRRQSVGEVDHQGDAAVGQAGLAGGAGADLPVAVLAVADRPHLRIRQALGDEVVAHGVVTALAQALVVGGRTGGIGEAFHRHHHARVVLADDAGE